MISLQFFGHEVAEHHSFLSGSAWVLIGWILLWLVVCGVAVWLLAKCLFVSKSDKKLSRTSVKK